MPLKPDMYRRTFAETRDELGLTDDELMRCVADGKIVPSAFFCGRFSMYSVEEDFPDQGRFWMDLSAMEINGLFYLVQRVQLTPMKCKWLGFSAERTADEGEMFYAFPDAEAYFSDRIMSECYFLTEEIVRFKNESPLSDPDPTEKPLEERERVTLLKMIIGMAIGLYKYDPKASRNEAIKEIVEDLQEAGVEVSDDTVRRKLQEASKLLR